MISISKLFGIFLLGCLFCAQPVTALDCDTFNATNIKIVSFDVFAALMDTVDSLKASIPKAANFSSSQTNQVIQNWISDYGAHQGRNFSVATTGGMQPFRYFFAQSLENTIAKFGKTDQIPTWGDTFNQLLSTWSYLIPRPDTATTLEKLSTKVQIATLSNGDADTLQLAMTVLGLSKVPFIYSSDYPVGAFKPHPAMYDQIPSGIRTQGKKIPLDQILHVAGAPNDGRGARDYGMYSALYNNPLPGNQPCFILKHITDLLPIFGLE